MNDFEQKGHAVFHEMIKEYGYIPSPVKALRHPSCPAVGTPGRYDFIRGWDIARKTYGQ